MTTRQNRNASKLVLPAIVALVAAALVLWLWPREEAASALQFIHADAETYVSIDELASDAAAIVVAVAGQLVAREIDYGTTVESERDGEGNPIVFREFSVEEVMTGGVGETAIVTTFDLDKADQTRFEPGQRVLLFLHKQVSSIDAPGITVVDEFWWPMNLDNGVFDVDGDELKARHPRIFEPAGGYTNFDDAGEPLGDTSFDLADVRLLVLTR